ncbi:hypothetical protein B4099_0355 [Heyndrickxia coagulans]|uniref:Ribosomal protein S14 n=1 Tax=Heyndrickxia coagulans TaxID=1398 RepID=A0A150K6M3_HEYCO|nr:hypothetical protein B4099_0355 [Heyndrickxia coagulans]
MASRKNLKHMAYYTRKVAEYTRSRRDVRRNKYRHDRLLQYKTALNRRLREELK